MEDRVNFISSEIGELYRFTQLHKNRATWRKKVLSRMTLSGERIVSSAAAAPRGVAAFVARAASSASLKS